MTGEEDDDDRRLGGSTMGRRFLWRDREASHLRLEWDYFADQPTYDVGQFRRRFHMRRELFLHLVDLVYAADLWFI